MIRRKNERMPVFRQTEHWIDWVVVGIFTVVMAFVLLSLITETPKIP